MMEKTHTLVSKDKNVKEGRNIINNKRIKGYLLLFINILIAIVFLFPLFYAISVSLKSPDEIYNSTSKFFPTNGTIANYINVFRTTPILTYIKNSLIVATITTILQILTASSAAFAIGFLEIKNKNLIFILILSTMMIPAETTIISNYLTISKLGMQDTLRALILPFATSSMGVFLFIQSFKDFPIEIYESAKIDGCNNFKFLFTILLPISRPTIGALSVTSFLASWNMYLWPLLVTSDDKFRTVQIGVSMLNNIDAQSISLMIAGVVVTMIPSLIIFLSAQKNIVKGLSTGAIKS